MVNKNKKRPSNSLVIRLLQIKTNMTIAKIKSKTTAKVKNLTILNTGKDVEE